MQRGTLGALAIAKFDEKTHLL